MKTFNHKDNWYRLEILIIAMTSAMFLFYSGKSNAFGVGVTTINSSHHIETNICPERVETENHEGLIISVEKRLSPVKTEHYMIGERFYSCDGEKVIMIGYGQEYKKSGFDNVYYGWTVGLEERPGYYEEGNTDYTYPIAPIAVANIRYSVFNFMVTPTLTMAIGVRYVQEF